MPTPCCAGFSGIPDRPRGASRDYGTLARVPGHPPPRTGDSDEACGSWCSDRGERDLRPGVGGELAGRLGPGRELPAEFRRRRLVRDQGRRAGAAEVAEPAGPGARDDAYPRSQEVAARGQGARTRTADPEGPEQAHPVAGLGAAPAAGEAGWRLRQAVREPRGVRPPPGHRGGEVRGEEGLERSGPHRREAGAADARQASEALAHRAAGRGRLSSQRQLVPPAARAIPPRVDEGYFPRGSSVLRRVHGTRIVGLAYGQRALLVQATDPLAFAGLMANTGGRARPFQRLAHTAKVMERIFLGSRVEADRETARVRRMHARVRGRIAEPAGRFPAGSEYRADAPHQLLWILASIADSAQAAEETFVRPLSNDEREAFWHDYLLVGELFGLPAEAAPHDYGAYRDYMAERLASPDLQVLPDAREICHTIIREMPVPAPERPFVSAPHFLVIGLLPGRVREMYGFDWGPLRRGAFEAAALSHRRALPVVPRPVRRGSCSLNYDLVAPEERRPAAAPV